MNEKEVVEKVLKQRSQKLYDGAADETKMAIILLLGSATCIYIGTKFVFPWLTLIGYAGAIATAMKSTSASILYTEAKEAENLALQILNP